MLRFLSWTSQCRQHDVFGGGVIPGYASGNWYGVAAPVRTPKETIAAIHGAAVSALKNPNVSKRLTDMGYIIVGDQPEQFTAHIKSEIATLAKIIRQTGVTVN